MARRIVFELCVETMQACLAGNIAGVDRIELCSNLHEEGLTPGFDLLQEAIAHCTIPIHVMLRPRGGNFVYTASEFDQMCADLERARSLGAAGVVVGLLHPDHTMDVERTRRLVHLAAGFPVTFHRAFDESTNPHAALEDVIAAGCQRVLTSGGAATAFAGASRLAHLVSLARGRIDVAAAGGLRLEHAAELARRTGAAHFHGTLRSNGIPHVDHEYVSAVMEALQNA